MWEKQALLATLLRNVARLPPQESAALAARRVLSRAEQRASEEALEKAVRLWAAKKIAPQAVRGADLASRGLGRSVNYLTRGRWNLSPEFREKTMRFAAKNPVSLLGGSAGFSPIPVPGQAEVGLFAVGGLSEILKRLMRTPTHTDLTMKIFEKQLKKRGYRDLQEYLRKTQPTAWNYADLTPFPVPSEREIRQLSPLGSSLV